MPHNKEAPEEKWLAHNGGLPSGNYPKSDMVRYVRADVHEAAVAAARKEGMLEAAKIAQSILKAEGTASYIPTAICAAAGGKMRGVSMRITGPNSDGEYWLHLSDTPANESCGINLDCPLGDVARRLLDAASEASK